jgi:hypothetical protein
MIEIQHRPIHFATTFGDRQRARSSMTTRQLLRLPNASKLRLQPLLKLPPTPQHRTFSSFPSLSSNNMNDDYNYRRRFESIHHALRLQDLRNPQRLRSSTGHYLMPLCFWLCFWLFSLGFNCAPTRRVQGLCPPPLHPRASALV